MADTHPISDEAFPDSNQEYRVPFPWGISSHVILNSGHPVMVTFSLVAFHLACVLFMWPLFKKLAQVEGYAQEAQKYWMSVRACAKSARCQGGVRDVKKLDMRRNGARRANLDEVRRPGIEVSHLLTAWGKTSHIVIGASQCSYTLLQRISVLQ